MPDLPQLGKLVVVGGALLLLAGLLVLLVARLGHLPRIPGDIVVQRPGLTIYAPLGTSLLLSLLLTLILLAYAHFRK